MIHQKQSLPSGVNKNTTFIASNSTYDNVGIIEVSQASSSSTYLTIDLTLPENYLDNTRPRPLLQILMQNQERVSSLITFPYKNHYYYMIVKAYCIFRAQRRGHHIFTYLGPQWTLIRPCIQIHYLGTCPITLQLNVLRPLQTVLDM